jgi:membrane protease YdiL (CAAX protease family)
MIIRRAEGAAAPTQTDGASASVTWSRPALFYGVALGGAVVVAFGIWCLRQLLGGAATVPSLAVTALLYMPLPMLAGLVVERRARRRSLLSREWQGLRSSFWRTYGRNATAAVALVVVIVVASFAVAWLAGRWGVFGAGHIVANQSELSERLAQAGAELPPGSLPDIWVLAGIIVMAGIVAGLSVNALFALGEEYGWRGVLADELRPLGRARATLLTGILWGLWHAPIIMLGHNYGSSWQAGILVMVTWTVPLSFLLTWARDRTGSVIAPAMLHGAFNGVVGVFAYLIIGGNVLIRLPVGLLMSLTLACVAVLVWHLPVPPSSGSTSPSRIAVSS